MWHQKGEVSSLHFSPPHPHQLGHVTPVASLYSHHLLASPNHASAPDAVDTQSRLWQLLNQARRPSPSSPVSVNGSSYLNDVKKPAGNSRRNSISSSSSSSSSSSGDGKPSVLLDILRGDLDFYSNVMKYCNRRSVNGVQKSSSNSSSVSGSSSSSSISGSSVSGSSSSSSISGSSSSSSNQTPLTDVRCLPLTTTRRASPLSLTRDLHFDLEQQRNANSAAGSPLHSSHSLQPPPPLKRARLIITKDSTESISQQCPHPLPETGNKEETDSSNRSSRHWGCLSTDSCVTDVGVGRGLVGTSIIGANNNKSLSYTDSRSHRSVIMQRSSPSLTDAASGDKRVRCTSHGSVLESILRGGEGEGCSSRKRTHDSNSSSSSSESPTFLSRKPKHNHLPVSTRDTNDADAKHEADEDAEKKEVLSPHVPVRISLRSQQLTQVKVTEWMIDIVKWAADQPDFCALPDLDRRLLLHNSWSKLLLLYMTDSNFTYQVERVKTGGVTGVTGDSDGRQVTASFSDLIYNFIRSGQTLELDDTERHMMRLMTLYNPNYCEQSSAHLVEDISRRIRKSLLDHVHTSYTAQPMRYNTLLMRMRTLYGIDCSLVEKLFCSNITLGDFTAARYSQGLR